MGYGPDATWNWSVSVAQSVTPDENGQRIGYDLTSTLGAL
jgi:hypothetical protein